MTATRATAGLRALLACAIALSMGSAAAEKVPMTDEEMSVVAGKGISIVVHLELNGGLLTGQPIDSRVSAGFTVAGVTTYAIAQNFGGLLDLFAVTLDPRTKPDGSGYLAIGMPAFVGAKDFGVRAIGVQADPGAPITNSLGSLLLTGSATMTGQLNVWAK
jgi:hypothetical protein